MVDVAGEVVSRRAVDGPSLVDLEHVFRAVAPFPLLRLRGGDPPAAIGDDIGLARDRLHCEQAEPGRGTADADDGLRHDLPNSRFAAGALAARPRAG